MWNVVFCTGAVYLLYLVFGGCLFMALKFIKALGIGTVVEPDVSFDFTAMKTELLQRNFTEEVIDSMITSWSEDFSDKTFDNSTIELLNTWSYANSFFFAFHLCSTIGYGDLAPKTSAGQMLVIAFVTLGIPINIIFFKVLGQSFAQNYEEVIGRISGSKDWPSRKMLGDIAFFIPWTLVLFVVPAVVFMFTEEWSFIEGLYSSFITLSTVGLGDYVAGSAVTEDVYFYIYKVLIFCWMIFGLAFTGMFVDILAHKYQLYLLYVIVCRCKRKCEVKIRRIYVDIEKLDIHFRLLRSEGVRHRFSMWSLRKDTSRARGFRMMHLAHLAVLAERAQGELIRLLEQHRGSGGPKDAFPVKAKQGTSKADDSGPSSLRDAFPVKDSARKSPEQTQQKDEDPKQQQNLYRRGAMGFD